MSVTILHITDIHAGPEELKDEDLKQQVPYSERARMLDRLTSYLQVMPNPPDYAIITGDLTIQGNHGGLEEFRKWILDRITEKVLPDVNHVIIVPGNHDVCRMNMQKESANSDKYRYDTFFNTIAKVFPHAYLPDCDPPLNPSKPSFDVTTDVFFGGLSTEKKHDRFEIVESFPFILDMERDILIFAFNSTLGCGVYLPHIVEIRDNLASLMSIYGTGDPAVERKFKQIRDAYEGSLLIDAGLVGNDQLTYFSQVMRRLKESLGARYSRLTKIAVMHHHISHLWRQQIEIKSFESVLDASQLKQYLIEYEFDLVLHGHKHTNHVALDGSMIPISSSKRFSPLCIISGGTVGGNPRLGDKQTFKLIRFDEDNGPRTAAIIQEIPLLDNADPYPIIKKDSTIYSVPITSGLPELHDLQAIKDSLDAFMRDHYAAELRDNNKLIISGAELRIPAAHPDIIGEASQYNCYCVAEKLDEMVFYDIIQATQRLDFRQKARIYWMLTDVKGFELHSSKRSRVIILVGNLEETHFFQGKTKGEIEKSIEEIKRLFKPASISGLLEIREHAFSQEEVEQLASGATISL